MVKSCLFYYAMLSFPGGLGVQLQLHAHHEVPPSNRGAPF